MDFEKDKDQRGGEMGRSVYETRLVGSRLWWKYSPLVWLACGWTVTPITTHHWPCCLGGSDGCWNPRTSGGEEQVSHPCSTGVLLDIYLLLCFLKKRKSTISPAGTQQPSPGTLILSTLSSHPTHNLIPLPELLGDSRRICPRTALALALP